MQGELFYANKDHFAGEWKNDAASGYGVLSYANGNRYEGNWLDDKVRIVLKRLCACGLTLLVFCLRLCVCVCVCSDTVTACSMAPTTADTRARDHPQGGQRILLLSQRRRVCWHLEGWVAQRRRSAYVQPRFDVGQRRPLKHSRCPCYMHATEYQRSLLAVRVCVCLCVVRIVSLLYCCARVAPAFCFRWCLLHLWRSLLVIHYTELIIFVFSFGIITNYINPQHIK